MFPESFAERWIRRLTQPGETVLDPFCGRGTTALTATLTGRRAVSCDVNDVAYCLTNAKTNTPSLQKVNRRLSALERGFDVGEWTKKVQGSPEFFQYAFASNTLAQLLY
jgi:site-specific DNA-methyltransferase (adenine-specific)